MTPPVAISLMVTARIAALSLDAACRWVGWLLLSLAVALGLVAVFP